MTIVGIVLVLPIFWLQSRLLLNPLTKMTDCVRRAREHCGEAKEVVAYVAPRVVGEKWEETREANLSVSLLPALSRLTEAERETIMTTRDRTEIVKILVDAGIVFGEQEETKETTDGT